MDFEASVMTLSPMNALEALTALHHGEGAAVVLARLTPDGWQECGAILTTDLPAKWPSLETHLTQDSYFSLASTDAPPWATKTSPLGLPLWLGKTRKNMRRRSNDVRLCGREEMSKKRDKHEGQLLLDWYGEMLGAYRERMTHADRAELAAWEEKNLGKLATSDWSGWERFLPKRPGSVPILVPKRRRA